MSVLWQHEVPLHWDNGGRWAIQSDLRILYFSYVLFEGKGWWKVKYLRSLFKKGRVQRWTCYHNCWEPVESKGALVGYRCYDCGLFEEMVTVNERFGD